MIYTERMSEALAIPVPAIFPLASPATGTFSTLAVSLQRHRRVLFTVILGTAANGSVVNFQVQGSVNGSTGWTNISSTAITQVTGTGTNGSNEFVVEVTAEQVQALALGYQYIRGTLAIGTAATPYCVLVQAGVDRFEPASNTNDASVAQIVVL